MIVLRRSFFLLIVTSLITSSAAFCASRMTVANGDSIGAKLWEERADSAQTALDKNFWFSQAELYYSNSVYGKTRNYWWQAHALDALGMGYRRTGDSFYTGRMTALDQGIAGSGGFTDNYYDDMEWMALALLRSYEATGTSYYLNQAQSLWTTIKGGWSLSPGGGGIRWSTNTMYKNIPANAPACILACKLYRDFGDTANLTWAENIHAWIDSNLVDHQTGVILDGISYSGSVGTPNYGSYSYNYGTYVGASLELYQVTHDTSYLSEAAKEADTADSIFAPTNGILRSEGTGDGGLFNGIYMYYLANLIREPALNDTLRVRFEDFLLTNADTLWNYGQRPGVGLFNDNWQVPPTGIVSLSVELSGVTTVEAVAEMYDDSALTAIQPMGSAIPQMFHLYQNFPNPFNPTTEISYRLSAKSFVTLRVYDVLGRLVSTLVNSKEDAGSYTLTFSGVGLASGIYFYELKAGDYSSVKKFALIK